MSDNGPQMTSGSTREFLALCAIAQHFGRPGTPTDQAWIESLSDSFEQQAADFSVEHADVTEDYREGRAVVREGRTGTEESRVALLRYRAVFERVARADATDDETTANQ